MNQVMISNNGLMAPKTIEEAFRYATAVYKSGLAPAQFDTPEKVMVGMQFAVELGLKPLTGLKSMYIVNGTPALFGDLPLALVRNSGKLESIEESQYDINDKLICKANGNLDSECSYAICVVKRVGEAAVERQFSWKTAIKAGLDKNKYGEKATYKNYRQRMLQMRARSWALKDVFGDVLNGISILEYDTFEEKDVTQTSTNMKKSELNDLIEGATDEKTND